MNDKIIKHFVKYRKFIIYLLLSIITIVLALFVFSYVNTIYKTFSHTSEFTNVEIEFYYLFLSIILLLVIPFTAFFILAVIELSNLTGQLRSRVIEQQLATQAEEEKTEEISEEEKTQQEKERIAQIKKQYQEKETQLLDCFNENVTKQNDKNHEKISEEILSCIGKFYEIAQGELYLKQSEKDKDKLLLAATYAYYVPEGKIFEFEIGEGLIGQVAKQGEPINLDNIPEGYITVYSGLGSATPTNMIIFPIKSKQSDNVIGVIELASFKPFSEHDINIFKNISGEIGKHFENFDTALKQEN